uniref:Mediator complex subunit 7 n=1 Tax=Parastrongyloides trichosuri TaxID=131310 RepID=A0A0N4Z3W2_PARTI
MLPCEEYQKNSVVAHEGDTPEDIFKMRVVNQNSGMFNDVNHNSFKKCIQNTLYYILETQKVANSTIFEGDSLKELERYIRNNVKVTLYQDLTQTILKLCDELQEIKIKWNSINLEEKNHCFYLIYNQIEEVDKLIRTLSKYCEKNQETL